MLFPKRVAETDSERLPLDGGGCRDLLMQQHVLFFLAQWEGFEPSDGFWPSHDFQSCSL